MKIIMCRGLPGSGKTTWAKQYILDNPNAIRVNKDELRRMLFCGKKYKGWHEGVVLSLRDTAIANALDSNRDVVVDDTNFNPIHEKRICELARMYNERDKHVEVEIKDFKLPLDECIKNDLKRADSVGERVIREMHEKYVRPTLKVAQDEELPQAVIFDLDGNLALFTDRSPYNPKPHEIAYDTLDEEVGAILFSKQKAGYKIIICSGRSGKYLKETDEWLTKHGIQPDLFLMRKEGDDRKDSILKEEMFRDHILPYYYTTLVLDDRQQVVDKWRDLGLKVFQTADGNF